MLAFNAWKLKHDILLSNFASNCKLRHYILGPDIPLFSNILSDLFPGVELPVPDYDHMRKSLLQECAKANLQPNPTFLEKTFQVRQTKLSLTLVHLLLSST